MEGMTRKLILEGWNSYRRDVLEPAGAGAVQVEECRRAFYSGAMILFTSIVGILDSGSRADGEGSRANAGDQRRDRSVRRGYVGASTRRPQWSREAMKRRAGGPLAHSSNQVVMEVMTPAAISLAYVVEVV